MEKSSANTDREKQMSDVAMAREYVEQIGGAGSVGARVNRAFELLVKLFPHHDTPGSRWTYRRVRSFWHMEAAHVEFREMLELHGAAQAAREQRARLEKGKAEHAEFIEQTARYRALLERRSADEGSPST